MKWLKGIVAWIESGYWWKTFFLPGIALVVPAFAQIIIPEGSDRVIALTAWGAIVLGASCAYQKLKPARLLTANELHAILTTVSEVVAGKLERFAAIRGTLKGMRASEIFKKITQPDAQIQDIIRWLYSFFVVTCPPEVSVHEANIRVVLARMGEKHISGWGPFFPPTTRPRSEISQLQHDYSAFSRAKAERKIIIVEDFVAESMSPAGRCFVVSHPSRALEDGSLICYPIMVRQTGEIPFVLSISASKKRYFRKDDEEVYKSILAHFEQRIVLEFFLQAIKQEAFAKKENPQ